MTINHNDTEFFLSFWLTEQPLLFQKIDIEEIKSVNSALVAKVVMTPKFAHAVLDAMRKNIESFEKKQKAK